jgi:hypothetical protein
MAESGRESLGREASKAVFLSYRSTDRDFARRLAGDLARSGIRTWLDESDLRAGDDIGAIQSAIRKSDCLVVILTRAVADSHWVREEVCFARSLGIKVLPVPLEEVSGLGINGLSSAAYADFRQPKNYRRAVQKLIAGIDPAVIPGTFLSAKKAVADIRAARHPVGDLFGVSQQGVALLYSVANLRDWEFADALDGTSRLWIAEFFDSRTGRIQPYALMDGQVHDLPEHYLLDIDPVRLPDSRIVFSCAFNPRPGRSEKQARTLIAEHPEEFTHVSRRYSRFRPIPLRREFVDSTEAVAAATKSFYASSRMRGRSNDLFVLAKLECDKRNRALPTWIVALFDPTLSESVAAVGVDAETGAVRSPQLRAESLNAAFLTVDIDKGTGDYVVSTENQLRAMDNHVWDIPEEGLYGGTGLTAEQALSMAIEKLKAAGEDQEWQVGYISNTGVIRTALSAKNKTPEAGLMRSDGRAGQWVFELFGPNPTPVSDGTREGYSYPFRQLLCTTDGVVNASFIDRIILTSPLARSPLPRNLINAYENARMLAIKAAGPHFRLMSVAVSRAAPEAQWHFRFYDTQDMITNIVVSADGYRLISSTGPPTTGEATA